MSELSIITSKYYEATSQTLVSYELLR